MDVQFVAFVVVLATLCNLNAKCRVTAAARCGLILDRIGYKNVPSISADYHDWALVIGQSSAGQLTGPKHGYSINTTDDCYLLFKTSGEDPGENALLISPCYTHSKDNENPQLKFFYNMYGRDIGSLNVYLRPGCVEPSAVEVSSSTSSGSWETIRSIAGNQGNQWIDVQSAFSTSSVNFQVIFEGISGDGTLDNIALDEIAIDSVQCNQSHFFCDQMNCIKDSSVCDTIGDCLDGTDEDDCENCSRSDLFLCQNGNCIVTDLMCDSNDHCGDNSDELNCLDSTNSPISHLSTAHSSSTESSTLISTTLNSTDSLTMTSSLTQHIGDPLVTDLIGTFTTEPTQNGMATLRTTIPSTIVTSIRDKSVTSTLAEQTTSPNLTTILSAVFGCLLFVLIVVNITHIVVKRSCRESPSDGPDVSYYMTSISNQSPDTHMSTSNLKGTSDDPSNVIPKVASDNPKHVIPLRNAGYQDLTIRPPESTYQGIYSDIP